MSRTLQWILGILAVVVVIVLVAGSVLMWRYRAAYWDAQPYTNSVPGAPDPSDPSQLPYRYERYQRYHMQGVPGGMPMHGYGLDGPYGMHPYGSGFFMLGGFLHLLVPLGILALIAYVFYQLGKRAAPTAAANVRPTRESPPPPARKVAGR